MFKVIIAGSRDFNDYTFLREKLDILLSKTKDQIEIVSGAARGADQLGERYARERNYSVVSIPADWNQYGKSAGYIRNEEMARYADACVAFWMNNSKGTKHMIDLSEKHNLKLRVYKL